MHIWLYVKKIRHPTQGLYILQFLDGEHGPFFAFASRASDMPVQGGHAEVPSVDPMQERLGCQGNGPQNVLEGSSQE